MSIPKQNPYAWQDTMLEQCIARFRGGDRDYLCVVTPGGGKTIGALKVAKKLKELGIIKRIVVVAPTRAVVEQWSDEANKLSLDLERFGNPERKRNYDGIVITYSAIAMAPMDYRGYCNVPTLIILDEIHHADKEQSWGEALRLAFECQQTYRLLLSGTPFRTKGRIPFIRYDPEQPDKLMALADFPYSHGDAVRAGACRRVLFPTVEVPRIEWARGEHQFAASLTDTTLTEELTRERNSVVLEPASAAVRLLLEQAHAKLIELRQIRPNAAGLVLAKNQWHAYLLAILLENITGSKPVCVVSDEPNALDAIRRFRKSNDPWIVSVRMVSEGVDIKRLQVLAYLTSTDTPLFFRQAVGRVTRKTPGVPHEDAYVFILNREPLISYAAELEAEQRTPVEEEDDPKLRKPGSDDEGSDPREKPILVDCDAEIGDTILTGGAEPWKPEDIFRAQLVKERLGAEGHTVEEIAELLRDVALDNNSEEIKRPAEPKDLRMERKLAQANKKAFALGMARGYPREEAARRIHTEWKNLSPGNHWQDDMDEPELDRKLIWLSQGLARAQGA